MYKLNIYTLQTLRVEFLNENLLQGRGVREEEPVDLKILLTMALVCVHIYL